MRNASLQILFKRPTPAIVFQLLQNPHTTCRIRCACHAEPHPKLKKCSRTASFNTFDFEMRFAPQRRALFRHLNFQKCSEAEAFCAFWLGNVLRATTACTFWTSQVPKMFPMCFLNFQKCSDNEALSAFWLPNVLCATTACNFSSLISPDGSAPAALASLLFDPPGQQIIAKTHCFATFLPFRAPGSSFLWLFLLWLLLFWLFLFSGCCHLYFSIGPYSWKFDF